MLISQNVSLNDVIAVKLVSGEEIVGKLLEQTHDAITIGKPVTVVLQPMGQKQVGLSFLPVLGAVEPDVSLTIMKNALSIRPVKAGRSVASSYLEMTTGLVTPGLIGA